MTLAAPLTLYKKQEGLLTLSKDQRSVTWTPLQPAGAAPVLSMDIAKISNLQQTPADKPKVMLKIFVTEPGQKDPVSHVFQFASKTDPRTEANIFRDTLSQLMQKVSMAVATRESGGQSAAMTIAAAISGSKEADWEDDTKLISNVRLQQTLLKENTELNRTYTEARNLKPESLSLTQFTKQFWSSRIHLLRAHALTQAQKQGQYNAFSVIEYSYDIENDRRELNITGEHIKVIFEQYPFLRLVYEEVVPKKYNEKTFWSRFFQSQLFKTLRGIKVDRKNDDKDPVLDPYLDRPELTGARLISSDLHIPKFIDLEGNEENHSQRQGNRPYEEDRSTTLNQGPVIRRLNEISERLMSAVRPSDVDASAPIGIDEAEYEQLRLRDLANQESRQGIELQTRSLDGIFSSGESTTDDIDAVRIRALDPKTALHDVCHDLDEHYSTPGNAPTLNLDLEDDDDNDMENEGYGESNGHASSGATLASQHIHSLIEARRAQQTESNMPDRKTKSYGGLSEQVYDQLILTHATTLEFLRQFWVAYQSGDPTRVNEVASLIESLDRAMDRINAVAKDAQGERDAKLKHLEAQRDEILRKTGRKKKIDLKMVGGGAEVVKQLLAPIMKSLAVAADTYRKAYEEQSKETQQAED